MHSEWWGGKSFARLVGLEEILLQALDFFRHSTWSPEPLGRLTKSFADDLDCMI